MTNRFLYRVFSPEQPNERTHILNDWDSALVNATKRSLANGGLRFTIERRGYNDSTWNRDYEVVAVPCEH